MSENAPSKEATLPILYSFDSTTSLANGLGEFVVSAQEEALKKNSTFKIAISGGSLPKTLGEGLLGRNDVKWDKWSVRTGE